MFKSFINCIIRKPNFRERLKTAEISRRVLRYLSKNANFEKKEYQIYFLYLYKTINKKSFLRVNNYCLYTGRQRGIIRHTRMSKIYLKLAVRDDEIVGIRRAVW